MWKNINFLLASFVSILFTGLGVVFALLLMRIVDAATMGEMETLLRYIIFAVLIAILEFLLGASFRYFTVRYAQGAMLFSKNKLYSSTLYSTCQQEDENIAMYTTNTGLVYADYFQNHPLIVMLASQFLLSIAGVIFIHWLLFLVVIGASILPMFAPVIFQGRLARAVESYSHTSKKYIDNITDNIKGLNEIKNFNAQHFFIKRHENLNENVEKARASHHIIHFLLERASVSLGSLSFLVIIGLGGYFVINDLITVGALIAVIQLVNGVVGPIGNLSNALGQINANKELAKKYLIEPEVIPGMPVPVFNNKIKVENITFSYPQSEYPVLKI